MNTRNVLLKLKSITKSFGSTCILDEINLEVEDGEFLTVLGPSGSGKTTILRMIGGFTNPTSGSILLDGQDISSMPINRRPFNTVFQDYAIFPHMTVFENIGYGLKIRGISRSEIKKRVADVLGLVHLESLAERYPAQISGGQKQRVALARAIVCRPRLILLDEPLSALDIELRKKMQYFLKEIQREIKTTFLFVTHDQEEAITMADRICVMSHGKIQQIGSPLDVYYKPKTDFVARFFGENNLISGKLDSLNSDVREFDSTWGLIACTCAKQPDIQTAQNGVLAYAVIRPESIQIQQTVEKLANCQNYFPAIVSAIHFSGVTTTITVKTTNGSPDDNLRIKLPSRPDGLSFDIGNAVVIGWRIADSRLVLR